jgi:signal transduction histidine kinase
VATLVTAGVVPHADVEFSWAAWWAGDLIGVFLFLPPMLAWSARPVEIWRRRRWTIAAPLFTCFSVLAVFFYYAKSIETRQMETAFDDRQRPIAETLQRELTRAVDNVIGLAAFFDASNDVERGEFAVYTRARLEKAPGVRALTWNPLVERSERKTIEKQARDEKIDGYTFLEADSKGQLRPERERDRYLPILYVEPMETNLDVLGFDLTTEAVRNAAVETALARAAPTVSARLHLLHEQSTGWSVLLMMPAYGKVKPSLGHPAKIRGLVVSVLRIDDLVHQAISGLRQDDLSIRLRDVAAASSEGLLYGTEPGSKELRASRDWSEAGRHWAIEISTPDPSNRTWTTWFVLAGGLLITGVFSAFILELATRQTQVERLVAVRTSELARSNDELQGSNIELQRFAHVASHDLREPLRAIGTHAQLLNESATELSPDHRKSLDRVVAAARRMQELIDDLLALSRLEGAAAKMSAVPLRGLVDAAIENLKHAIDRTGAVVQVEELPTLTCDSSPIVQLFQNLIANAVKFRREGETPRVSISSRRVGDHWEIAVKDNGIGIAPEHHARIFEMFERLHPRERYGGTGIGLAICRKIVDRHGGKIWVESPPEGGSVFRFTLRAEGEKT